MKINKYKRKKLEQFTVKEVDYYQYVFNEFDQDKRKVVINFAVLFFGFLWFFYRKMYVIGTILLLYPFVLFGLIIVGRLSDSYLLAFFAFVRIIESYFANRLYWYKWNAFCEYQESSQIKQKGIGVNLVVPITVVGILFCFSYWLLSGMMQGMRHT